MVAPAQCDRQDHGDGGERDGDGQDGVARAATGDQGADDGQIDGHRQVFDDEQVQDRGRLPVAEPVEIGEHLGHDAGRADPAHAAEERGRGGLPPEDEADDEARREVRDRVDHAGNRARAQPVTQLVGAVLEAEREQEEQHADLAGEMDEVGADVERCDPALADGEPGEQVEGDGGDAEPTGQPREHREHERDGADLDEGKGRIAVRGRDDRGHASRRTRSL